MTSFLEQGFLEDEYMWKHRMWRILMIKKLDKWTRNSTTRSKILNHFIKGKISLSPMETIIVILKKL
jgi:hypothetical protein